MKDRKRELQNYQEQLYFAFLLFVYYLYLYNAVLVQDNIALPWPNALLAIICFLVIEMENKLDYCAH